MINSISWTTMKNCIDQNTSLNFFFSTEFDYKSNDPNESDMCRYFIRQEIFSGVENQCFIIKDGGVNQTDFDDNYKGLTRAIETQ